MSAKEQIRAEKLKLDGWKVTPKGHDRDFDKYKYLSVGFDMYYKKK